MEGMKERNEIEDGNEGEKGKIMKLEGKERRKTKIEWKKIRRRIL